MDSSLEQSLDNFLAGAAELAITHVVSQARSLLASTSIYVCGECDVDYDDNYYYVTTHDAFIPITFVMSEEEAKEWCSEQNRLAMGDRKMEPINAYHADLNETRRNNLVARISSDLGKDEWSVTWEDLSKHVKDNGLNVDDYTYCTATYKELNSK